MKPRVSVLISAYRRHDYVEGAVRSALADGADEIVVLKDWADSELDSRLAAWGVVNRRANIPTIGQALALGIIVCSGDVISFLDDDDLIVPGRTAAVRSAFHSSPKLKLFKNGYLDVDSEGRPASASGSLVPQPEERRRLSDFSSGADFLRWAVRSHAYGVLSTLSVDRDAIADCLEDLARVECGIDVAVGVLLLRDGFQHLFDPRVFTLHRLGSYLRKGRPTGEPRAYARTFHRLSKSAAPGIGRAYARMNARWATWLRVFGPSLLDRVHSLGLNGGG